MRSRPTNALIANGLAMLPWPMLILSDHANSGCGDGLCGSIVGPLLLLVLLIVTIVFLYRSSHRNEAPALLRFAPIALWAVLIAQTMI